MLALLVTGLGIFAMAPSMLKLGLSGTENWYIAGSFASSLVAGLLSFRAAAILKNSNRRGWSCFGLGCFAWMVAIVIWAGYGWAGSIVRFPSLADLFFLGTSGLFAVGLFYYSLAGSLGRGMQVTNFTLALCSTVATGFIIYFPVLLDADIGFLGAFVGFAYPAVGLSTWAFGLICYCLYIRDEDRFPFLLILTGLGATAVANTFYGFDVLGENYSAGTAYDIVWIAGFAFVAWAALEQGHSREITDTSVAGPSSLTGQALVPAISTAAVMLAVVVHLWDEAGAEYAALLILPFIVGLAGCLTIREYWLFATERTLRNEAENTGRKLAESEARLSGVLENTTDGVMVLDRAWRITFANQNAIATLFSDRRFLGVSLWELHPEAVGGKIEENYRKAMKQQRPVGFEVLWSTDVWYEVHLFPTPDNLTVFFRDITEQRQARAELVRLAQHDSLTNLANRALFNERLEVGLDSGRRQSDLILVLIDLDDFKVVNDTRGHQAGDCLLQQFASRLAGLVREGDTVARLGGDEFAIIQPGPVDPEEGAGIARRISEVLLAPFEIEGSQLTLAVSIGIAVAPKHGTRPKDLIRSADLALFRAKETKGTSLNYCIFEPGMEDHLKTREASRLELQRRSPPGAEPKLAANAELSLHNARITTALNQMSQGLCMFDADKKLIMCNERYAEMYGIPPENLQPGTPFQRILQNRLDNGQFNVGDPEDYLRERIKACAERVQSVKFHHLTDGRLIAISHSPLDGGGWVATHDDITDIGRMEAKMTHMARHDGLTDLPNRTLFREELDRTLQQIRPGERLAVLCLDIDQFRSVNDTLGHAVGDALLCQVADRLRKATPGCDLIARRGGDAFAILKGGMKGPETAKALAQRVIHSLGQPYEVDGHKVVISTSIGIAVAPTDSGDADQLLKLADMALYRCKLEDRGAYRFFEPEMDVRTQARRALELDLRKALVDDELVVHYQPLVDIHANRVTGFEALLRWNHAERGNVSPSEFIPVAEEIGLIRQIGAWVLKEACAEAAKWPADVRLAVNVSPAQFKGKELVSDVVAALKHSGLPAGRLELEVTETAMLQDTGPTLVTLHSLRDLGVHISLDDFGTGCSSLSFLRKFPFDRLKIDRSFIGDMNDHGGSSAIARAVLALSSSLGMSTTAEGVETLEQLAQLRAEGCVELQGHFFSTARPASEIEGLLTSVADKSRSAPLDTVISLQAAKR